MINELDLIVCEHLVWLHYFHTEWSGPWCRCGHHNMKLWLSGFISFVLCLFCWVFWRRLIHQHQQSHYGKSVNVSMELHCSALGLMTISLRRLSISNEVANHPIRQNQCREPSDNRMGTQQVPGREAGDAAAGEHVSSFSSSASCPLLLLLAAPACWPPCPCTLFNLPRKDAHWLWRLLFDEIFISSHEGGVWSVCSTTVHL